MVLAREWEHLVFKFLSLLATRYFKLECVLDGSLPLAIVVSDLNREGLTSLVKEELLEDPKHWLFESLEDALNAVDKEVKRPGAVPTEVPDVDI